MSDIQQHITKHPWLTASEIAEDLDLTIIEVRRVLVSLEAEGIAKKSTEEKGTYWSVK